MASCSAVATRGLPAFSSTDPGFEALPVEELLAEHEPLLGRIKLCYGADRTSFDRDLMPMVRGYAAYVHLLPTTPDNYFKAPGGLLRLGLETAFFALQGPDAHIFSGKATIASGLYCELHRVLSHLIATTPEGEKWPSVLMPLLGWLREGGVQRYFVRWRPQAAETRGLGLFALPLVVPATALEGLRHADGGILRQLFASVGGVPQCREHNILDDLVRRSLALVIDRHLAASAERYGSPQYGSHLERYLVDALRRLAAGHSAWIANRDKGRLWLGEDGLFLVWPAAPQDILELLEGDQLAGIPKAPDTLLDILLDAGVLQADPTGGRTWPIFPAGVKAPTDAVKFSAPDIVLAGIEPVPAPIGRPLQRCETVNSPSRPVPKPPYTPARRSEPDSTPSPQLSLIEPDAAEPVDVEPATPGEATGGAPPAAALHPQGPRPIRLKAPMRLNPAVRQALQEAVDTLNDPPVTAPVFTVRENVFVPLADFEHRGVQPTVALRALLDIGMLHRPSPSAPPTTSHDVRGVATVGVVLLTRHVDGLDPLAFAVDADPVG